MVEDHVASDLLWKCATKFLSWLRRRRERAGWIDVEADNLIGAFGPDAYAAARTMQRRARGDKERLYWRDMARAIARVTAKRACLDMVKKVLRVQDE